MEIRQVCGVSGGKWSLGRCVEFIQVCGVQGGVWCIGRCVEFRQVCIFFFREGKCARAGMWSLGRYVKQRRGKHDERHGGGCM